MAINTIERLLDKISQKTTLEMTKHSLITNGYFINNRVLALFKRYPLTKMQVTLDGSRERHNSIRKTKTDLYTYDKIIENTSPVILACIFYRYHILTQYFSSIDQASVLTLPIDSEHFFLELLINYWKEACQHISL